MNKNVDIKFNAHDAFLEKRSPGTLKSKDWKAYKHSIKQGKTHTHTRTHARTQGQ